MIDKLRWKYRIIKRKFCKHNWEYLDPANSKRLCTKCDKEEWLSETRYPMIGQLKYYWVDHTWDNIELTQSWRRL